MAGAKKRLSTRKRIQYRVEWAGLHALFWLGSAVPLAALRRIGRGLGWFAWRALGARRSVVVENISRSFPEAPAERVNEIGLESYEQYGVALMEFAGFRALSRRKIECMVAAEGFEHIDAALARGRGAVLFSGHFGNWELLGALVAGRGYPLHVTDTNHSNELTHRVITGMRVRQGMSVIAPDEPSSRITALLAENKIVSYLADQDARRDGIFVDFLGRPASTVRGPAIFAIRKGCPIVPIFMIREGTDRHRAVAEPPIWPDPSLKGREAVRDLTQRYTMVLETYVRAHPGQYFWMHRRWKTKPAAAPVA
jgi:KDO2-lipid IV(A) lauroyltransferase